MAKPVSIFADVSQGNLFFEGTRIPPAPLGGIVLAIENPSRPGKIRVTRSDQFSRDGVTPRRLFKRMDPVRVKNATGQFLVGDLGFSLAQVIDYINSQANKNANDDPDLFNAKPGLAKIPEPIIMPIRTFNPS